MAHGHEPAAQARVAWLALRARDPLTNRPFESKRKQRENNWIPRVWRRLTLETKRLEVILPERPVRLDRERAFAENRAALREMNVRQKIPQVDAVVIHLNGVDRDHRVAHIDGLVRSLARTTAERNLRSRGRRQRQSQQNSAHSHRCAHCASFPRGAVMDSSRGKFR